MANTTKVKYPDNLYVSYTINGIIRQLIKESYYWEYDLSANPYEKHIIDLSRSNFDNATDLNKTIFGNSLNPLIDLSGYSFNDLSGNIYDLSGRRVDASGIVIDHSSNIIDLSGSVIFDISGNLIKSITDYTLSNNSYRRMLDYKLNQYTHFEPIVFLAHPLNVELFNKGINTRNLAVQYYILYDDKKNDYSKVVVGNNIIRNIPSDNELIEFFLLNIADFTDPNNKYYALQNANGKTVVSKTNITYRYVTEPSNTSRYLNFADVSNKIKDNVTDPSKTLINNSFYLFMYSDVSDHVQTLLNYGTYTDDHLTFNRSLINTICKAHYIISKHVRKGDNNPDENRYSNKQEFLNSSTGTPEEIIFRAKYKEFNNSKGDFDIKHYLSIYASEFSGKVDPESHYVKYVYELKNNTTGFPNDNVKPTEPNRYQNLTQAFFKQNNTWKEYVDFPKRFYYALNKDIRDVRINDLVNNNNNILTDSDEDVLNVIIPGHYVMNNKNEITNPYRNSVNKLKEFGLSENNIFTNYQNGTNYNLTKPFSSSAYFFMNPDLYPWADDTLIDEIITVYNYVGSINKNIVVNASGVALENRPTYNDTPNEFIIEMGAKDLKSAATKRLITRPDLLVKDPSNDKQITLDNYVIKDDFWNDDNYLATDIKNEALQNVILQHWKSENPTI
jgi:hypothetical protein